MKTGTTITVGLGCKLVINDATIDCVSAPSFWGGIRANGDPGLEQYGTPPDTFRNSISSWEGVIINDQPIIILENNANINNAHIGVKSEFGAIVRARNSNFYNCERGIQISLYKSTLFPELNASHIMDCNFTWDRLISSAVYGIFTSVVKTIPIGGCNFSNSYIPSGPLTLSCQGNAIAGVGVFNAYVEIGSSGNTLCYNNEMDCPDNR